MDWYPWGPEALARAAGTRPADLPLDRLLGVPLVPRHGARELRGRGDREGAQRAFRLHQGGSRGAAGPRHDLHERASRSLTAARAAAGRCRVCLTPDLHAVLRRHLLPARRPLRPAELQDAPARRIADAWANRRDEITRRRPNVAELPADDAARSSRATPRCHRTCSRTPRAAAAAELRPDARRLRPRPEVPARPGTAAAAAPRASGSATTTRSHMVRHTLDKMARGGMYDQVGGGFAPLQRRRAVARPALREDALRQRAPHRRRTSKRARRPASRSIAQIAGETLDYVLREMTDAGGGVLSHAGRRQRGRGGQVLRLVARRRSTRRPRPGAAATFAYGLRRDRRGNWEGHNILYRARSDEHDAKLLGDRVEELRAQAGRGAARSCYEVRSKRVWPGRDEKILTAWNGLMIAAFAKAGAVFGEPRYSTAAVACRRLRPDAHARRRTAGCSAPTAVGSRRSSTATWKTTPSSSTRSSTLYEATFEPTWLRAASELADVMLKHFADPAGGVLLHGRRPRATDRAHEGPCTTARRRAATRWRSRCCCGWRS